VDVQAAMSRTAMGDASNALALAGSLIGFGRAHGYTSLLGRAEWLSGTALVGLGRLEDAFGAYKAAIAAYDQARYTEHRLFVRSTTADALRLMGETTLGWTYLGLPLRQLDDIGRVRRRYAVLLNASLFATDQQLLRAALAFQNGALDLAVERGVSNTIVEGLISRAELAIRIGQTALAASDLKEAARLLPAISAPAMREYQDAWLQRVSAELAALTTPVPAVSRLEDIVPYFAQHEPAEVPAILLARGRAARSAGQLAVAEESFSRGLSAVERLSTGLESDQHRTSYLAASWDLYDESVDLQATMNVSASAWRLADAGRQRALGGQAPRSAAAQIGQISLPSGTVLLYFATLRDRLLVWMADSRGVRLKEMPIGSEALGLRTRAFRRLIESGADRAELDHLGKDLFRLLIEPAGDLPRGATILIAPDGALPGLPFAALIDPSTERYLIEDHPLVIVPSAQFLETGRVAAVPAPSTDRWRVVTIGNASPGDGSAPLPEARRELEDVAALYGTVTSLTGARATAEAVAAAARDADVIHFAGHARSNVAFPWLSSLLLTPDPQHPDGRLTVGEIGQWRLPRARLVVLSGCETAFGGGTRNPGVLGLSRPFLLAGARSVVGSLWEVDDRPTRVLMSAFHRAFKKVADPVLALQAAQLELIRGPSGNQLPRDWAGFATVGR